MTLVHTVMLQGRLYCALFRWKHLSLERPVNSATQSCNQIYLVSKTNFPWTSFLPLGENESPGIPNFAIKDEVGLFEHLESYFRNGRVWCFLPLHLVTFLPSNPFAWFWQTDLVTILSFRSSTVPCPVFWNSFSHFWNWANTTGKKKKKKARPLVQSPDLAQKTCVALGKLYHFLTLSFLFCLPRTEWLYYLTKFLCEVIDIQPNELQGLRTSPEDSWPIPKKNLNKTSCFQCPRDGALAFISLLKPQTTPLPPIFFSAPCSFEQFTLLPG